MKVILTRELKRCPSFSNLKTLSLGEWCIDAEFDALVFLLQHSPNLEKLFLELKLVWVFAYLVCHILNFEYLGTCLITLMVLCKKNLNTRKPLVSGVKPKGRSFACKHLRKVKLKCSKDDVIVHKLAHLFRANGVPDENIFVRRGQGAPVSHTFSSSCTQFCIYLYCPCCVTM